MKNKEAKPERRCSLEIMKDSWKTYAAVPLVLREKNPLLWSIDDVGLWLLNLNFDAESRAEFMKHKIDGGALFDIEEDDLLASNLFTALGPRKKFLRAKNNLSCAYQIDPKPLPFYHDILTERDQKKKNNSDTKLLQNLKQAFKRGGGRIYVDYDDDDLYNNESDDDNEQDKEKEDAEEEEHKDSKRNHKGRGEKKRIYKDGSKGRGKIVKKNNRKINNIATYQKTFFSNCAKLGAGVFILMEMAINKIFPFSLMKYTAPAFLQLLAFLPGVFSYSVGTFARKKT